MTFSFFQQVNAEVLDRVLVVVNTETILDSDVRKLQSQLKNAQAFDDSLGLDIGDVRKSKKAQVEYLISQKIIDSEIKRLTLTVTNDRVEQEVRELARRNKISVNEVYQAVKNEGMSVSEYQSFIRAKIERQNLFDAEIISKLKVSEEEVRAEYNKVNKDSGGSMHEFTLAHIYFNPKKGGDKQAQSRAQVALTKLKEGAAFETAAEQYSEDPNFSNGGFLGVFKTGESIKELEAAVVNLNPGNTSGVVKTKIGYHILKLLDKKTINDPQFEKQREHIRAQILEKYFKRQLQIWLQNKRDEAFIRYNQVI